MKKKVTWRPERAAMSYSTCSIAFMAGWNVQSRRNRPFSVTVNFQDFSGWNDLRVESDSLRRGGVRLQVVVDPDDRVAALQPSSARAENVCSPL